MALNLRTRTVLATAALLTGTTLLTACQDGSSDAAATPKTEAAGAAKPGAKQAGKPAGVSGTFAGGTVEYLAPGKYIVDAQGKEQQFFTAEDTKVYGAGTICGTYQQSADTPCTLDDLEKVLKDGSIPADVVMKNGIATRITERPAPDEGPAVDDSRPGTPPKDKDKDKNKAPESSVDGINKGKGVNGTWLGNVRYLAPGKYTVSDLKGAEQQFFIADDTKIWGAGAICGDDAGQAGTECTEAELEAATKKAGVSAEVVIVNGIATTVREDH
ncbi:hypothetical protein ACWF94_23185 [Streptomyces sp. NPDC055078]